MKFEFQKSKSLSAGAVLSLVVALALAGCGQQESIDKAVVTTTDPGSVSNGADGTGTGAAAKPAGDSGAAAKPEADAAKPAGDAAAAAPAAAGAEGWGTLKGRVVFGGDAPAPAILVTKGATDVKDPAVCATHDIPSEALVVNAANKGVKNVIVYIPKPTRKNPDADKAAKEQEVEFDQKGCIFIPHVMAVAKGAKVTLKSSDAIGHNVNSQLQNTRFNQGIQPNGSFPVVVKNAETRPGRIVCDIHNWMTSWWLVVDSPYFAVTDADGNFEIKNVPSGDQKVVVWQESVQNNGFVTAPSGEVVNVKTGDPTSKDFTIDASKIRK